MLKATKIKLDSKKNVVESSISRIKIVETIRQFRPITGISIRSLLRSKSRLLLPNIIIKDFDINARKHMMKIPNSNVSEVKTVTKPRHSIIITGMNAPCGPGNEQIKNPIISPL